MNFLFFGSQFYQESLPHFEQLYFRSKHQFKDFGLKQGSF